MWVVKMCMGVKIAMERKGRQGDNPSIHRREAAFNIFSDDQSSHPGDLTVVVFFSMLSFSCGIATLRVDRADIRSCKNE